MSYEQRVAVLSRQLCAALEVSAADVSAGVLPKTVHPDQLNCYIVHDNAELRHRVFDFLKGDLYKPNYKLSLMEFRELTLQRLKAFGAQRFFSIFDYLGDTRKFMAAIECLAFVDYSLAIKSGVHYQLCGVTIAKLGTQKHHEKYLAQMDTVDLPGCFGMTELGHGSNVMGIETQLTVNGKWEGVHVFVVPLRDSSGRIMPGVRIEDNGPKMGLNGVDNGRIWFDHVRVPKDALLDAFASVDDAGRYNSPLPTIAQRFGTMVGGLTTGRLLIAQGAIDATKIGLTIAIRYSSQRPQFGDKVILSYLTHQRRLFPGLAATYAHHILMGQLKDIVMRKRPEDTRRIHVMSSGLKAAATWTRSEVLQHCRECCGGQGFLSANRIGPMKTDMDVDTTFEGDNTVLMQQVARVLLDEWSGKAAPAVPAAGQLARTPLCQQCLGTLLTFQEQMLTSQVASALSAAGKAGRDQAFEEHLDLVVQLGWAHLERLAYEGLLSAAAAAPAASTGAAIRGMALLYGATRVERSMASYLAAGAANGADAAALRLAVNGVCAQLAADAGRLALSYCEAFGIADHLLQAPIAFDWRTKL